jgi:hypothetical protein
MPAKAVCFGGYPGEACRRRQPRQRPEHLGGLPGKARLEANPCVTPKKHRMGNTYSLLTASLLAASLLAAAGVERALPHIWR